MIQVYLMMIDSEQDKDRFTQIYEKHRGSMYAVAVKVLKNHHLAEEVVQDVLLKLACDIHILDRVDRLKTRGYILSMVKNRACDILGDEKKFCETIDENSVYINEELFTPDILEFVVSDEGHSRLLEILEQMDYTFKETLRLKLLYEYTNDEIAEIQNVSKRAVEMRIYRGRVILKEILKKECDDYAIR